MSAPKMPMGFVCAPRDEVQGYLDARAAKHRIRQGGGEDESGSLFRKMQAENRSFIQDPRFDLGVEVEDRLQSHVQVTHVSVAFCPFLRPCAQKHTRTTPCTQLSTRETRINSTICLFCSWRRRRPSASPGVACGKGSAGRIGHPFLSTAIHSCRQESNPAGR